MALRGKKPEEIQKRLKAFFYGAAGVGKTFTAIQFPKPYLIDTEKGAENEQYVKKLQEQGGAIFQTSDFEELISEIKALMSEKHDYKTLIIDPLTTVYNDLLEKAAHILKTQSKEKDSTGTEFGRHYTEANRKIKHLVSLLLRLDMNVIITSHSKNEYSSDMKVLNQTFDCYKKLDYLFDLVFEVQKRGKNRVGIVKKTRIEAFGDGEQFPFNYEEIAKRYGSEILEKDSTPQQLSTPEQIKELTHLIEKLHISSQMVDKWLTKAAATTFDEMQSVHIQACINSLKNQILSTNGETL